LVANPARAVETLLLAKSVPLERVLAGHDFGLQRWPAAMRGKLASQRLQFPAKRGQFGGALEHCVRIAIEARGLLSEPFRVRVKRCDLPPFGIDLLERSHAGFRQDRRRLRSQPQFQPLDLGPPGGLCLHLLPAAAGESCDRTRGNAEQ
jgi:hypothetical protein